jgi:hypothetical protein
MKHLRVPPGKLDAQKRKNGLYVIQQAWSFYTNCVVWTRVLHHEAADSSA